MYVYTVTGWGGRGQWWAGSHLAFIRAAGHHVQTLLPSGGQGVGVEARQQRLHQLILEGVQRVGYTSIGMYIHVCMYTLLAYMFLNER